MTRSDFLLVVATTFAVVALTYGLIQHERRLGALEAARERAAPAAAASSPAGESEAARRARLDRLVEQERQWNRDMAYIRGRVPALASDSQLPLQSPAPTDRSSSGYTPQHRP